MDREALLQGLDADQLVAVTTPAAPLAIVAGPGAGKTRVLTRRIAHRVASGDADPRHVLAITFTRRAAAELTLRLRDLGLRDNPTVGTFHAIARRVLAQRSTDQGRRASELVGDRTTLVATVLGGRRSGNGPSALDVSREIDWARARLIRPEAYAAEARRAGRRPSGGLGAVSAAYAKYEQHKRTKRIVDLDDLLERLAEDIESDPLFAEVQRWRFRHLFVDEFQDVNPLQLRLLRAWLGPRTDLCVVGDPNQAIYGWNGADPTALTDVSRHLPGVTIVRLPRNHRATPALVAASTSVLADPPDLRSTRPDGPPPAVHRFADERAEAEGIARLLDADRRPGTSWSACAVLVRTNAQVPALLEALARVGVPARARRAGVLDDPAVRAALAGAPPPNAGYGLRDWLADLDDAASGDEAPDRPEALVRVVEAARRAVVEDPAAAMSTLRGALEGDERGLGPGAVDVTTFHAAKGLEWPVVVVAGCEDGFVPHAGAADVEEERRLLYVAMTRAEQRLHLTWAEQRTLGGGVQTRRRTPWLDRLPAAGDDTPTPPPPSARRPRTSPPPEPVLEALRAWRLAAARAAGVPPTVVCADAVLAAVAARRPRSPGDLASVPGLSPQAARRFGPRLLEVVATAAR